MDCSLELGFFLLRFYFSRVLLTYHCFNDVTIEIMAEYGYCLTIVVLVVVEGVACVLLCFLVEGG